jgi:orotidine-5'-phosphate decarboxylase
MKMSFKVRLQDVIIAKNSLLCVGLDPDIAKMPRILRSEEDAVFKFCAEIIAATRHVTTAYKLNFAFFEALGSQGWRCIERLTAVLPEDVVKIADAKRADIGNSSAKYAEAILDRLAFDAITVNPYMGLDSVRPFLAWPEKGAFVLALTSNPGSQDVQYLESDGTRIYMKVIEKVCGWNDQQNCGLVVGATHPGQIAAIRNKAPELPFLIPGIGSQGGSLEQAILEGTDSTSGMALLNSSRGILYQSDGTDFAEAAAAEAERLCREINRFREQKQTTMNG